MSDKIDKGKSYLAYSPKIPEWKEGEIAFDKELFNPPLDKLDFKKYKIFSKKKENDLFSLIEKKMLYKPSFPLFDFKDGGIISKEEHDKLFDFDFKNG